MMHKGKLSIKMKTEYIPPVTQTIGTIGLSLMQTSLPPDLGDTTIEGGNPEGAL